MTSHIPRRDINNQDFYKILERLTNRFDSEMVTFFESNKSLFENLISLLEDVYSNDIRLYPDMFGCCEIGDTSDRSMSIYVECNNLNSLDIHLKQTDSVCFYDKFLFIRDILFLIKGYFFGLNRLDETILEIKNKENHLVEIIIKLWSIHN